MHGSNLVEIDARGFIRLSLLGPLTDLATIQASRAIRNSTEFQSGMPTLIDLSGITSIEVATDTIVALAQGAQSDRNRVALFAPEPEVYGLARVYEIIGDLAENRVRVFHEEALALSWLGV